MYGKPASQDQIQKDDSFLIKDLYVDKIQPEMQFHRQDDISNPVWGAIVEEDQGLPKTLFFGLKASNDSEREIEPNIVSDTSCDIEYNSAYAVGNYGIPKRDGTGGGNQNNQGQNPNCPNPNRGKGQGRGSRRGGRGQGNGLRRGIGGGRRNQQSP